MPSVAGASAEWPPASSGNVEPYSVQCPVLPRSHGWTALRLSFRRSLSRLPPSAISVGHLHENFVNNAPALRWVNSTPAFSLIFSSAITPGQKTEEAAGTPPGKDLSGGPRDTGNLGETHSTVETRVTPAAQVLQGPLDLEGLNPGVKEGDSHTTLRLPERTRPGGPTLPQCFLISRPSLAPLA